jgi:hypothetical protein
VNPTGLAGLGFVILAAIAMVGSAVYLRRASISFRDLPAFARIQRSVRLLVESGTRLHFSLGNSSILAQDGASALAGLALLRRLGEITSLSDRPPVATTGNSVLNLLAQDTLRAAHAAVGAEQSYEMTQARLVGLTPFSYAAGVMSTLSDENISSNILIGNFGPEVGLLTEAATSQNTTVFAASDNLTAQAVLFASSTDMLIGEELFASGAYAQAGTFHSASLIVQDVLRWLIILALLFGAVLKLAGLL